ncbi:MAG: hypothetical protein NTV70_07285 [Acidobacteria bacterium]|nr:hypothetical protein [Acidobacteriota bacterium]
MPDKPTWYGSIPEALAALEALESPWIDRQMLQTLLGVGRRRAQQLMKPLANRLIGRNLLVERDRLRQFLSATAAGEPAGMEHQRRLRLARQLEQWARTPRLPVEAPARIIQQQLTSLPAGIELTPGRIAVHFTTSREAMEKLLALALAISNDLEGFEVVTESTDAAVQLYRQSYS